MTAKGLTKIRIRTILTVLFACSFFLSLARIHLRVQTTLIGYEIGQLKNEEFALLEERANKKMDLAKLTTRKHLTFVAENGRLTTTKSKSLASQ